MKTRVLHSVDVDMTPGELARALGYDGGKVVYVGYKGRASTARNPTRVIMRVEYVLATTNKGEKTSRKFRSDYVDELMDED